MQIANYTILASILGGIVALLNEYTPCSTIIWLICVYKYVSACMYACYFNLNISYIDSNTVYQHSRIIVTIIVWTLLYTLLDSVTMQL